jgi:hypothetical protein
MLALDLSGTAATEPPQIKKISLAGKKPPKDPFDSNDAHGRFVAALAVIKLAGYDSQSKTVDSKWNTNYIFGGRLRDFRKAP